MGHTVSRVVGCFGPVSRRQEQCFSEPLDEGIGHSFCYIRPSLDSPQLSPGCSDRFDSESCEVLSSSFRSNNNSNTENKINRCKIPSEAVFKAISGASVSANTSTPRTAVCHEYFHSFTNVPQDRAAAFESTASFAFLPLQPVPRATTFSGPISGTFSGPLCGSVDRGFVSGPIERVFMSGPIERNFMSGPLEKGCMPGQVEVPVDRSHFSAPLAGYFSTTRERPFFQFMTSVRRPVIGVFKRSLGKTTSTFLRTKKSIVAPFRQLVWKRLQIGPKRAPMLYNSLSYTSADADLKEFHNLQWAEGKAGEDRVHIVISEEHGWLFVGIYDGFNGPDAPDFLMRNLYRAMYRELQGLLFNGEAVDLMGERVVDCPQVMTDGLLLAEPKLDMMQLSKLSHGKDSTKSNLHNNQGSLDTSVFEGTICNDNSVLAMNSVRVSCTADSDCGRSCSGVCAQSHADETSKNWRPSTTNKTSDVGNTRSFPGPSCRELRKKEIRTTQSHKHDVVVGSVAEPDNFVVAGTNTKQWRHGVVSHADVLKALARGLAATEEAYLDMADQALDENPELALIGSCILVVLMRDNDVYVLNVGDSRAIIAQSKSWVIEESKNCFDSSTEVTGRIRSMRHQNLDSIAEEGPTDSENLQISNCGWNAGPPSVSFSLRAVQLSTDHNTNIEEETCRIKSEHPDDNSCISNNRVKGRLKVTRAFGAGFLKKPRWNNAVLKMFQIDYVGTTPYISCIPALHHHKLGPNDRFLILSSDGLYQYFTNEEVVSHVEWFMDKFPEGDPAQHLIEELLFRAAKKAGMDFHELLDVPQGDRRKYHDDVSVIVISLEGKIWRSSGHGTQFFDTTM